MAFYRISGCDDADSAADDFKTALLALATDEAWTLRYEKTAGSSLTFNRPSGTEATTNRVMVFRSKLAHNSIGADDNHYSYLIIEVDTTGDKLIIRTTSSVNGAGVNANTTPVADTTTCELTLGDFGVENAVNVMGSDRCLTLALQTPDGIQAVSLFSIATDRPTTSDNDRNAGLCRAGEGTAWVLPCTDYAAGVFNLVGVNADLKKSRQGDRQVLSRLKITDSDTFIGVARGVYLSHGVEPDDFDIITLQNDPFAIVRVISITGGYIGVES